MQYKTPTLPVLKSSTLEFNIRSFDLFLVWYHAWILENIYIVPCFFYCEKRFFVKLLQMSSTRWDQKKKNAKKEVSKVNLKIPLPLQVTLEGRLARVDLEVVYAPMYSMKQAQFHALNERQEGWLNNEWELVKRALTHESRGCSN